MQSRYAPNLTAASAGIPMLEKDDVEFNVGDVKSFYRQSPDQQNPGETKEVYGVQFAITLAKSTGPNEKYIGKTFPLQLYLHSEGAYGIAKRFVMSCLGFPLDEEDKFNEKYANADWSYGDDPSKEGNTIPENAIWHSVKGTKVAAGTDIKPDKRDPTRKNQQYDWRPI